MAVEAPAESWWLMECSLPDLNWARLRVARDGSAEVFDCDGKTHRFPSDAAARLWLAEDEFVAFDDLEAAELVEQGLDPSRVRPPSGASDTALLPLMYVKAPTGS